jgi:N-acylneuraminate cytidylyltransferase
MPTRDQVDAVVTDFDGVHTDNTVWVDQDGREAVQVSRADGFGVAQLVRAGVKVAILSAETNPVVARRAAKLGVACRQGVADKAAGLAGLCQDLGVDPEKTIYVGNDLGDLPAMRLAGWPVAVADACPDVLAQARLATRAKGGQGAIREIAGWLTRGGPSQ